MGTLQVYLSKSKIEILISAYVTRLLHFVTQFTLLNKKTAVANAIDMKVENRNYDEKISSG